MKTPGIVNINVRVVRENKPETDIILIYATVWTNLSNLKFKEFLRRDLVNIGAVAPRVDLRMLNLNLYLEKTDETSTLEEYIPINCFLELKKGINADFKFNEDMENIFVTNVILNEVQTNPTGTKRTVITYEDTDVIDDTYSNKA